ncbi:MAG: glutathione S-transferase family protein, partial [Pseudomonadota bacterium]
MITVYAAPRTRAVRIVWLLEEMGLPYELELVNFKPTTDRFFIQDTPTGKIPTLVDDDVVMSESGAIIEYLLEKYGGISANSLAPATGTAARARYLQWLHYAESTAFSPLGVVIWLTLYRQDARDHPVLVEDARARAERTFEHLAIEFGNGPYLLEDQ